ncbi:MAG: homoserine dehydrogenase [Candidatus Bathyarchaeia archaeon]
MRIALFGYGNVGRAVARLLDSRRRYLEGAGLYPKLVAVADSRGVAINPGGLDCSKLEEVKRTKGSVGFYPNYGRIGIEAIEIISDRLIDIDVVIEVTPTNIVDGEPGLTHIREALKSGLHVVTANKGPLALAMPSLLELAQHTGRELMFSGTVGGGTPFIRFAEKCLAGDRILGLEGILNGTCNYILSSMEGGLSFEQALREAQRLGYAEADPSMDVDGWDTACKIVILAVHILGARITLRDVEVKGIRGVTEEYLAEAYRGGTTVKLLGSIDADRGKASVAPVEIPRNSPLAVSGNLNALTFHVENLGSITVIGKGAGGIETAHAILKDLIELKMRLQYGSI